MSPAHSLQRKMHRQDSTLWSFVGHGFVAVTAAPFGFSKLPIAVLWSRRIQANPNRTRCARHPFPVTVLTLIACAAFLACSSGATTATFPGQGHAQPGRFPAPRIVSDAESQPSEPPNPHHRFTPLPEHDSLVSRTERQRQQELRRALDKLDALLHTVVEVPSGVASADHGVPETVRPSTKLGEPASEDKLHGGVVHGVLEPGLLEALAAYRIAASDAEARGDEEGGREAASALLREIARARNSGHSFGFDDHRETTDRQSKTDREERSTRYDDELADEVQGWSPLLIVCTACVCVVLAGLIVVAVVQVQSAATVRHRAGHPEMNAKRHTGGRDTASRAARALDAGDSMYPRGDAEEYTEASEGTFGSLRRRKTRDSTARDQAVWSARANNGFRFTEEAMSPSGARPVKQRGVLGTVSDERVGEKTEKTLLDVTSSSSEFSEEGSADERCTAQPRHWKARDKEGREEIT